ncbi:MAG TPA: squalene synthase HpnC [Patescibacteria group bacterium]|nr:squalene synthase HpnC [Patescibacteria group bacterium]
MKFSQQDLIELTYQDGGSLGVTSIDDAYAFCKKIALRHYENFPVGSLLIPEAQRPHFFCVYAFSRLADDIADEMNASSEIRLKTLLDLEKLLKDQVFKSSVRDGDDKKMLNPVFLSLHATMDELNIPVDPFLKLLRAFRQDSDFKQPESFKDVLLYCEHSANPVGEIVLRIFGFYNAETARYSDAICTGLQLANFWQDFSIDLPNGRLYVPEEFLIKYSLDKENLQNPENSGKFRILLIELLKITDGFFKEGANLLPFLKNRRLRLEIALTIEGGRAITGKVRSLGSAALYKRPSLNKKDYFTIMFRALHVLFQKRDTL